MAMIMPSAHEVSPVLEELNHGGPTLAIDSEEIFKPERPGASKGKPDFTLRSIGATSARSAVASIRLALRTAAVSQNPVDAFGAACEPSRAWRKRDLRKGPSHGGNTSGSRADETFRTTST